MERSASLRRSKCACSTLSPVSVKSENVCKAITALVASQNPRETVTSKKVAMATSSLEGSALLFSPEDARRGCSLLYLLPDLVISAGGLRSIYLRHDTA